MTFPVVERRRFPRLLASEDARVLNLKGTEIGRIADASAGGVSVQCATDAIAERLEEEGQLRVIIVEPRTQASRTVDVAVRHREGRRVGMEYVESL
jgi:hypothetical protein